MGLAVGASVLAVDVAEGVRMKQRVIKRRVEHGQFGCRAASHLNPSKRGVPRLTSTRPDDVETCAITVFGGKIGHRVRAADIRDADADAHRCAAARIEADVGARAKARDGIAVFSEGRSALG